MVATRFVIDQTGPASLALLRYAIGVLCLLPVALATPRPRFAARDLVPIALLGIVQFGVLIALLNVGLRSIPAARAAVIFATLPLLTMLLATALGHERLGIAKAAGVLLTIVGVAVALGEKAVRGGGGTETWIGEAAVFASALSGAICSVLYRPYVRRYPTVPVSALAMLASVGFLAALAAGEGFFTDGPSLTRGGWAAVAFIGVSSGVGYFLWLWALGNAPATEVTVFLSLSPFTAAALGALLLAERVSVPIALGLGCVGLGLWLAHRGSDSR
jgi:drug/metabolite transporter (DMT)-like permease